MKKHIDIISKIHKVIWIGSMKLEKVFSRIDVQSFQKSQREVEAVDKFHKSSGLLPSGRHPKLAKAASIIPKLTSVNSI